MEEIELFSKEEEFYVKEGIKTIAASRFKDFSVDANKCYDNFLYWYDTNNALQRISYLAATERSIKKKMSERPRTCIQID